MAPLLFLTSLVVGSLVTLATDSALTGFLVGLCILLLIPNPSQPLNP